MLRRFALLCVVGLVPGFASAQAPDKYMPAGSLFYHHSDGFAQHRAAYEKTAFAKALKGDDGKFVAELKGYVADSVQIFNNFAGAEAAATMTDVLDTIHSAFENGFAIGLEAATVLPPKAQIVVVLPKGGAGKGSALALARRITDAAFANVREDKVGNRTIFSIDAQPVSVGWWRDGDDIIITAGTDKPQVYAKRIDDKETGLGKNALFKSLAAAQDFEITTRGFVDIPKIAKLAGSVNPDAAKLVEELGLNGLGAATWHCGYQGAGARSVIELEIPGKRKGVLLVATNKTMTLADLPPMPRDVGEFAAGNLNIHKVYQAVTHVIDNGVKIFAPDQADEIKELIKQFENRIGVKLSDDLFSNFDDLAVFYSSSKEGPLGLGRVILFKVKDEAKLRKSLDKAIEGIQANAGLNVKKRAYRGADVIELHSEAPGMIYLPTVTVHKGWLAFAQYPQPIHGYIQRANGQLPSWKAGPELLKALEPFPKQFTGITVSDPRPPVEFALSLLPTGFGALNGFGSFVGLRHFDLSTIPLAEEFTKDFFPSVTIATDDGKKLRSESRRSIFLP